MASLTGVLPGAFWRRQRDPLDALIATLQRDGRDGRLLALERLPAVTPRYAEPSTQLPPDLRRALITAGLKNLYAHQAETLDRVVAGEDVVLVTPTASGKTLAFALPLLVRLLREPGAKAICVYPTNALIHDQERALRDLLARLPHPPRLATLTGATTPDQRRALRANSPAILLTNPEMVHLALAEAGHGWARLLGGLRLLVLDEAHSYRGLFGAHVALTVRRLLRSAALLGASPTVIASTATVGNPAELATTLTGRACAVIEGSGAARGARTFAVWQPGGDGRDADAEGEAADLLVAAVRAGLGTILFTLSRRGAEHAATRARTRLGPEQARKIAPYRSGYAPAQRRELEARLRSGDLLGVVATNALEVGIDVGRLDVAITAGFPGSRTSLWQQLGRAGRGERPSLGVFVPFPRAIDSYYAAHPAELRADRFEDAVVDLDNPNLVAAHLVCAATGTPLAQDDLERFGPSAEAATAEAVRAGLLRRTGGRLYAADDRPHARISLRGGVGDAYDLIWADKVLGVIDGAHLCLEVYLGATYLHGGDRYRVVALDERRRRVELVADADAPDTSPLVTTTIAIAGAPPADRPLAPLLVSTKTTGYLRRERGRTREQPILLEPPPEHRLRTVGTWLTVPEPTRAPIERRDGAAFLAGLHGLEHLLPAAVAILLACDPRDLIATAVADHATLGGAVVFLYDAGEGGNGIATRAARNHGELLRVASAIVAGCGCRNGCPRCVLGGLCRRAHTGQEKAVAAALLAGMQ